MTSRPESRIETRFEEPGTIGRPRIIGRVVRLALSVWLLWGLYALLVVGWEVLVDTTPPSRPVWWLFMAIALLLTPYVVNIGFTQNWKHWPWIVVVAVASVAVLLDLLLYGTWWAPPLGAFVWLWLVYFSAHLGLSFVLSSLIATPGCEMRAIPHLWTVLTGQATKEHYCPGLLDRIDKWEAERSS